MTTPISDDFMRAMLGRARTYTIVLLRPGPAYQPPDSRAPELAKIVWEHGRRNFELRAAGQIALVGPLGGAGDVAGMSVFSTGVEETRALMADDPAIRAGIFVFEARPWISFPGDSLPA